MLLRPQNLQCLLFRECGQSVGIGKNNIFKKT